MAEYASNQRLGFFNAVEKIAIVGAAGTIGAHITASLLESGRHTITALSRKGSPNKLPAGVAVAAVDYGDEAGLVAALRGQQFLIITLAPMAPRETHGQLVRAAAKAGVRYVMPNSYGGDNADSRMGEDVMLGPAARAQRAEIEALGMSWVNVCCGFWYDYSLGGGEARFGFDLDRRALTLYDEGTTRTSTTTLAQVGRAVAAVLALPLDDNSNNNNNNNGDDARPTLSSFLNRSIYIKSFVVSQADMLASVQRVTGTTDADWTVTREPTRQRYHDGLALVRQGNMAGFGKMLYARAFYPEDALDVSAKAHNELLGLPQEDLDEATRDAMALAGVLKQRAERMAN
ncbi:isoflavone reductase family protein (CipA) [Cordyceps javanica]|uniref:Isoflavone reductase family protein (CipA) n=1 Tax=Cordyceps javanica TaxID=43265 RepID=A0A545ULJ7_9HYPO|nr:isoflavone reductase family protein (CipA) [Cordyceps javanica]TQW01798.1 isoflavone reductase family protein (CipA) [Cordyceps javanica]